jgi:hypothetical protein
MAGPPQPPLGGPPPPPPGFAAGGYPTAPQPPAKKKFPVWAIAVICVVGLALVAGIGVGVVAFINRDSRDDATDQAAREPGTKGKDSPSREATEKAESLTLAPCTWDPDVRIIDVGTASKAGGGADTLKVTVKVETRCDDGDVINSQGTRIIVSDSGGAVAVGDVDFDADPLMVGPSGAELTVTFGPGAFWSTSAGPSASALTAQFFFPGGSRDDGSSVVVEDPDRAFAAQHAQVRVTAPAASDEDAEAAALAALIREAAEDTPFVESSLQGRWSPQLSSKYEGLNAEGKTWTDRDIWNEFTELRDRYPSAVMIDSTAWSSYRSDRRYWVTSAGITFSGFEDALAWCTAEGFDKDHCFAKQIGQGDPQGTTKYNK